MSHRGRDDPGKGLRMLIVMSAFSLPVLIALAIWAFSDVKFP